MAMRICLEQDYVLKTLAKSKKNDLAVVDIDNIDPKYVREAVARGVHVFLARPRDSKKPEQKVYILITVTSSTCASPDLESRRQSLLNLLLEHGQCMSLSSK